MGQKFILQFMHIQKKNDIICLKSQKKIQKHTHIHTTYT